MARSPSSCLQLSTAGNGVCSASPNPGSINEKRVCPITTARHTYPQITGKHSGVGQSQEEAYNTRRRPAHPRILSQPCSLCSEGHDNRVTNPREKLPLRVSSASRREPGRSRRWEQVEWSLGPSGRLRGGCRAQREQSEEEGIHR